MSNSVKAKVRGAVIAVVAGAVLAVAGCASQAPQANNDAAMSGDMDSGKFQSAKDRVRCKTKK